ncbi:Helicase-like transcription factor CHR28 [Colletotrichum tanaceti]|uniref:Helicase-like transcription factor CHR28 n=1 Tax=Colletotrichum tanaceti TaxID=1306861 RepID=A0A4U6XI25_9PEZI|nr:Helicase-like transcription factor CHR28 [Colletotrichum tanaceti]TKW55505.1 Helicase-like transcription factor CHR28 [Colletotrichum tanaceti]
MSLLPGSDTQEKLVRRPKGPYFPAEDDESDGDESLGFNTRRRANYNQAQVPDLFDESVEDTIDQMRGDQAPDNIRPAARSSPSAESHELFVEEGEQLDGSLSAKNITMIKSEPDNEDDGDFEVIQLADASPEAQNQWSCPRRFVIDLTDAPDEDPVVNTEPAVKKEPVVHVNPVLTTLSSHLDMKALEARSGELQLKVLQGGLSPVELSEMMSVIAQLGQARNLTETKATPYPSIELPGFENRQQASGQETKKKPKQKRRPRVKTAAEYWARREEDDREREAKGLKRKGVYDSSGSSKAKKTKGSQNTYSDPYEEEIERQIDAVFQQRDAIQDRADRGDLPAAPTITATTKKDQLKQMREAAPEYFDPKLIRFQRIELSEATKSWGYRAVRCMNGLWQVRDLNTPMMNHQLIVGAWMLGRELRETPNMPRGGILADAMGLGKTIETLSCIVGNQASESLKDAGKGATLVICPSGQMIGQWMSEVRKHCDKKFAKKIVHFKAGNKMDMDLLASFNIVFASFHQIRDSIPSVKDREEKRILLRDEVKFDEWVEKETGDLHRIEWHRVVLDEAHAIKNHLTHSAFACYELKAKHRWAVSGTPLINGGHEFFSYLKFIKYHGIDDFTGYLQEYREDEKGRKKHNKLIHEVMYRRTQGDFFLGQPILDLPNTHPTHQYLKLSAEETVIFRMMERCFRRKMNQDFEDGSAASQIRCYLVMLLRLRQAATHPFLLEGMMGDYFSPKDLQVTKERLKALRGRATVYGQIGSWTRRHQIPSPRMHEVLEAAEQRRQDQLEIDRKEVLEAQYSRIRLSDDHKEAQPRDTQKAIVENDNMMAIGNDPDEVNSQDEVEEDEDGMVPQTYRNPGEEDKVSDDDTVPIIGGDTAPIAEHEEPPLQPFGRSDFGLAFDMTKQLEYLERLKELETAVCVACEARPAVVPVKGRCGCIFCGNCAVAHLAQKGRNCPKCRRIIGVPTSYQAFNDNDEVANDAGMPRDDVDEKAYSRGFDFNGFQHTEDEKKDKKPIRFLQLSDKRHDLPVTPSAKMTALKETVLRWQAEAPDDKIIIFSQFNVVMKIIGRMLESEGICFAYLSGKQNTEQRNKAVDEFQNGDEVKVLIVSLRAGGQCLNLTRGNRVILMELWWNHGVEQQAFARVFRIGQIKETHFVRFIVHTPIEQRMLQMQVQKILDIDAVLQDDMTRAPKISVEDIAGLLGKVTMRDGVMHVVSDYEDEDDDDEGDIRSDADEEEEDLEDLVVPDHVIEYEDDEEDDLV